MSNVITVRVSSLIAENEETVLRKLIAWEMVGRSVNELNSLSREWTNVARETDDDSERRLANAIDYAASVLIGDYLQDDESDDEPMKILFRGDLHPIIEAAQAGVEYAYGQEEVKQ